MHTADLHLGSRLKAGAPADGPVREVLERATFRALERVVDATLDAGCEFLVVAGDLYDADARSVHAQSQAIGQFERLAAAGVPVFVVHGNHDPLQADYAHLRLPKNVTVFGHDGPTAVPVHDAQGRTRAVVLGVSYRGARESRKLAAQFAATPEPVPHVAILHTALDPNQAQYAPCSLEDLCARPGIAYWALGHRHKAERVRAADPCVVYPGVPQGHDVGEPGPAGCVLVELPESGPPALEFVPTTELLWSIEEVDLGAPGAQRPVANLTDVGDAMAVRAEDLLAEPDPWAPAREAGFAVTRTAQAALARVVRWRLTGATAAHADLNASEEAVRELVNRLRRDLGAGRPFLWTESVRARTAPVVADLAKRRADDPVLRLLFDVADEWLAHDGPAREAVRAAAGAVWTEPTEREQDDPMRLDLSEPDLDELLGAARDLALAQLLPGGDD